MKILFPLPKEFSISSSPKFDSWKHFKLYLPFLKHLLFTNVVFHGYFFIYCFASIHFDCSMIGYVYSVQMKLSFRDLK